MIFDLSIRCIQHTGQTFLTSFVTSRSALVAKIWPCEVHGPLHSWFTSKIGDTVHKSFEDSNHGVVNGFYEVFFSFTQKLPKLEQQTSWRISATGVQSEHSVSSDKRSAEKIQNTGGWRERETGVCAALCNLTIITRYRSCCWMWDVKFTLEKVPQEVIFCSLPLFPSLVVRGRGPVVSERYSGSRGPGASSDQGLCCLFLG